MVSISVRHCFGVAKLQDVVAKTEQRTITKYANFFLISEVEVGFYVQFSKLPGLQYWSRWY